MGGDCVLFLFVFCFLNNTFCVLFICSVSWACRVYSAQSQSFLYSSFSLQQFVSLLCAVSSLKFFPKHLTSRLPCLEKQQVCWTGCKIVGVSIPKCCSRRRQLSRSVRICLAQPNPHLLIIHFLWIVWFDFGRTWSLVLAKALALSAGVAYLVMDGCSIPRQGQASLTLVGTAQ